MLTSENINEISSYHRFRYELSKLREENLSHGVTFPIHLVWVKGYRVYSMVQYLAVRAAHDLYISYHSSKKSTFNKFIFIYNDIEPENNEWWEKTKQYATVVHITPPRYINGRNIPHPQHIADLMRICIIHEFGGMYIDTDLLLINESVFSLVNMLNNYTFSTIIMCKETENKVWNGLIIGKSRCSFLERWIREYETKYGNPEGGCWWAGLSVETPMRLYKDDSTDIVLLDTHTFLPFGFYDDKIYNTIVDINATSPYPLSYGVHLWETEAEKRGVLPKNKEWFTSHKHTIFAHLFSKYILY